MKPFDDKFADNVREVFDNYQEPVDEQAWKQMKSSLQARQRKAVVVPMYFLKVAAVILLLLVPAFLWMYRPATDSVLPLTEEVTKKGEHGNVVAERDELQSTTPTVTDETRTAETQMLAARPDKPSEKKKPVAIQETNELIPVSSEEDAALIPAAEYKDEIAANLADEKLTAPEKVVVPLTDAPDASHVVPVYTEEDIIRDNLAWQQVSATRTSHVEVDAGSMKTWSPGEVAGGLGFSAGIARLWDLGSNFSFSGGGALVYNRINLTNTSSSYINKRHMNYYTPVNIDGAETIHLLDQQVVTDMEFLAIDFPLNFRYKVMETSNKSFYVSAGLSSFLYLQQSYTQQTEYLAEYTHASFSGPRTFSVENTVSDDISPFGRFDLARFLNISAGYGIQSGNSSFVIEPYIKLPVADVTSLNMSIGMAGVSLKYKLGQ
ncbi:MAG: hypothetical protein EA361_03850 [Bacteroidetes bacterium]|nr:MAG: hypothetical protein EA361_03850 [Bacteroidota bacterium]